MSATRDQASLVRCAELSRWLARRDEDSLSRAERQALRAHVETCAACRAAAIRHDPLWILAPLASPVAEEEAAKDRTFASDLSAVIEAQETGRRLRPRGRPFGRTALLLQAAAVLLAVTAGVALLRGRGADDPTGGGAKGLEAVSAAGGPALRASSTAGVALVSSDDGARERSPLVEGVESRSAVVFEWQALPATAPEEAVNVAFVVDQSASI